MSVVKTYVIYAMTFIVPIVFILLLFGSEDIEIGEAINELEGKEPIDRMPFAQKSSKTFTDIKGLAQDDPQVIEYLRGNVIYRPSNRPYKLGKPELKDFSQFGQPLLANDLVFHNKRNGFFVEVGAVNGEYHSNSLFYERELGWTGILIEPNYDTFSEMRPKHRKAYEVHGALASEKTPHEIHMLHHGFFGVGSKRIPKGGMVIKAYPLYSLLLAVNVTTIDFLSLDVEGQELNVLKSLPWDKVKIMVICAECTYIKENHFQGQLGPLGYKYIGRRERDAWFVHPEVWKEGMSV